MRPEERVQDIPLGDLFTRVLSHQPALMDDVEAVAQVQKLRQFGRDEEHGRPILGQLFEQQVDLFLGPDINADRGVVEEKDPGRTGQAAGEQNLLLIAALEAAKEQLLKIKEEARRE